MFMKELNSESGFCLELPEAIKLIILICEKTNQ
jgi:hypothetical protein